MEYQVWNTSYKSLDTLSVRDENNRYSNRVYLDEVAHNEPPHPDLHCLSSSLSILNMIYLGQNIFLKFCSHKFCCLLFWCLKG